MLIANPFTGQVLNANPEGCNQYKECPKTIRSKMFGTHMSSNLDSIKRGLVDRPKLGFSVARRRWEEQTSPTTDEPVGKEGRALVSITGQGLDYDRPDHRKFLDSIEDTRNIIPILRSLGVDWVNGWNTVGESNELHIISPSKAKVLKTVERPINKMFKENQKLREVVERDKPKHENYAHLMKRIRAKYGSI
jgi:hypothetical protein